MNSQICPHIKMRNKSELSQMINQCYSIYLFRVQKSKNYCDFCKFNYSHKRIWFCTKCFASCCTMRIESHIKSHFDHTNHQLFADFTKNILACACCNRPVLSLSTTSYALGNVYINTEYIPMKSIFPHPSSIISLDSIENDNFNDNKNNKESNKNIIEQNDKNSKETNKEIKKKDKQSSNDLKLKQSISISKLFYNPKLPNSSNIKNDLPYFLSHNLNGGESGLVNVGNSCYMNSTLQVLLHSKKFMNLILRLKSFSHLYKLNPKNSLLKNFGALAAAVWSGRFAVINPREVFFGVWKLSKSFEGYSQQDAQEFLSLFLLYLSENLYYEKCLSSSNEDGNANENIEKEKIKMFDIEEVTDKMITSLRGRILLYNQKKNILLNEFSLFSSNYFYSFNSAENDKNIQVDIQDDIQVNIQDNIQVDIQHEKLNKEENNKKIKLSEDQIRNLYEANSNFELSIYECIPPLLDWLSLKSFRKPHRIFKPILKSPLEEIFWGEQKTEIQCLECNKSSITKSSFLELSLIIKTAKMIKEDSGHSFFSLQWIKEYLNFGEKVPISLLLKYNFREEKLEGQEAYFCSNCFKEVEAISRTSITKFPEILILHLKRFAHSAFAGSSKVHTKVDFPLKGLKVYEKYNFKSKNLRKKKNKNSLRGNNLNDFQHFEGGLKGGGIIKKNYKRKNRKKLNTNIDKMKLDENKIELSNNEKEKSLSAKIVKDLNEKVEIENENEGEVGEKLFENYNENDLLKEKEQEKLLKEESLEEGENQSFPDFCDEDFYENNQFYNNDNNNNNENNENENLKEKKNKRKKTPKEKKKFSLFNLIGLVVHKGNLNSGHYYSVAKHPVRNAWFEFNDKRVTEISEDKVLTYNPYLLFYSKENFQKDLFKGKGEKSSLKKFEVLEELGKVDWLVGCDINNNNNNKEEEKEREERGKLVDRFWLSTLQSGMELKPISEVTIRCKHGLKFVPDFDYLSLFYNNNNNNNKVNSKNYRKIKERSFLIKENVYRKLAKNFGKDENFSLEKSCNLCKIENLEYKREKELESIKEFVKMFRGTKDFGLIDKVWLNSWKRFVLCESDKKPNFLSENDLKVLKEEELEEMEFDFEKSTIINYGVYKHLRNYYFRENGKEI